MILSAIGVQIAEINGVDKQVVSASIFLCCGYGLIVFRAAVDLKDLPRLTADLNWMADQHARKENL